ncbi:MAG TPA: regulatory protein GemA [Gallionella sp.]
MTARSSKAKFNGGQIFGSKLKLIHIAKRALRMTDEDYRALLQRVAGVKSSSDLTPVGFDAVMAEFNRLGFVSTKTKRKPKGAGGTAPNHPTPAQWRLIEERAKHVGYAGLEDPRFIAWVKPRGKVEHPRFLDNAGAQRVIAALGNWIERNTEHHNKGEI